MGDVKQAIAFDKLGEKNYVAWSYKMKLHLVKEEVWDTVSDEAPEPKTPAWTKKNAKAMSAIANMVNDSQVKYISNAATAKAVWEALQLKHQHVSLGSRIRIMKNLFRTVLKDGDSMRKHLDKLRDWFEELNTIGAPLEESVKMGIMFASANRKFDNVITAMEAWTADRLTVQEIENKLIEEDEKMNGDSSDQDEGKALKSVIVRPKKFSRGSSGGQPTDGEFLWKCHFCRKPGHKRTDCPDLRRMLNNSNSVKRGNKESALKASKWYKTSFENKSGSLSDWCVDSGATVHMCANEELFTSINRSFSSEVSIANGEMIKVCGIGAVTLNVRDGKQTIKVTLEDVLWLPDLDGNLVSVKKLVERGHTVEFSGNSCFLKSEDSDVWEIARWQGKFYNLLEAKRCYYVSSDTEMKLCVHDWHRRLAHRNLRDIRVMEKHGLEIRACQCIDDCEMCIKGKLSRKPFPKKATPTKEALDCIVSDICGPFQLESLGRKRYFQTFVDVHTGYTEVKLIREKSEAARKTIEFVEMLKTQTGRKMKILRTDRGKEYLNDCLQSYLKREGIKFQCTVGYAPEQNGVAERRNRTLVEAARTMLADSGLPKTLWAEAVCTANYVFNRLVDRKSGMTPIEAFFGVKPSNKRFYEFGCDAYVMIPYEKRRKLDDKAQKVKFVGYDEESKAFRFIDKNFKIIISREAKFLSSKQRFPANPPYEDDNEALILEVNEPEEVEEFYDAVRNERENSEEEDDNSDEEEPEETRDPEEAREPETPRRTARRNAGMMSESLRNDFIVYAAREDEFFEPKHYKEAVHSKFGSQWTQAMVEELNAIEDNDTWELVNLPYGRKAIGSKWIYKVKKNIDGTVERRKARLVAQGFSQKFGVDYDEVFAPVARTTTMRLLLSVAGINGYDVKHYDIKTAFLNGKLDDEIYMKQPPGFGKGDKVYRLKKSLYGLKQAAKVWNETLNDSLMRNGFRRSDIDKCLYMFTSGGVTMMILIHVDDLLVIGNNQKVLKEKMEKIGRDFELKNLGDVSSYLGIEVTRDKEGNFLISQQQYIQKIIEASGMTDAKESRFPVDTGYYKLDGKLLPSNDEYRKLIGMLLFLTTQTRPDIAASVAILSQKVTQPRDTDLNEARRIVRYLKGTKDLKLRLSSSKQKNSFYAYSDANWAEDREDRKSNSGFYCSINGGAISWSCRKQNLVATSSTEAEFVALSETCREVVWLKKLAKELSIIVPEPVTVYTDSQSSMEMVENEKFSNRTKHIDTKFHYVKDAAMNRDIILEYVKTDENVADMLTKPLGSIKIEALRRLAALM